MTLNLLWTFCKTCRTCLLLALKWMKPPLRLTHRLPLTDPTCVCVSVSVGCASCFFELVFPLVLLLCPVGDVVFLACYLAFLLLFQQLKLQLPLPAESAMRVGCVCLSVGFFLSVLVFFCPHGHYPFQTSVVHPFTRSVKNHYPTALLRPHCGG